MAFHYNDTLEQQDVAEYKAQAVNAKFKQQVAYGLGAALVFGLVSAMAKTLFDTAALALAPTATAGAMAAAGPILGLVALGVAGVGLLYLSAKFLSENTLLDQHLQAKQISGAARERDHAKAHVQEFPAVAELKSELPSTSISGARELADTVTPRAPKKAADVQQDWRSRMQANDNQPQTARAI